MQNDEASPAFRSKIIVKIPIYAKISEKLIGVLRPPTNGSWAMIIFITYLYFTRILLWLTSFNLTNLTKYYSKSPGYFYTKNHTICVQYFSLFDSKLD